ncbi:MAG: phosphate ABC transporter substrate-binding protein [Candidatus Omnitrophica bacterium]|nr:phosphate ABC transporter substrate-binding protein [Candidatus Omnitrophota bacterium]
MKKLLTFLMIGMIVASSGYAAEEINIVGSTTVLPIAQLTAEEFMNSNPGIEITVGGGGSSIGAKALVSGTCDIADCSRPLKDKEIDEALAKGIKPKPHIVAMDGIAVVVNKSNNLKEISSDDLKAIYTGDISNWSEVGGSDAGIVVVSRDTSSGTYEAFNELALKKAKVRPDALLQASNKAVLQTVVQTPNAIGYIGMGYLDDSVNALVVEGVFPTKDTVLTKEYPISRPLYMYTDGEPKGQLKKYLDYVKSVEGQKLVESQGFVGIA